MRPSGIPLYTSSGAVAVVSPGEVVHLLDEREFLVLGINPHSSTVVLRRVDVTANQRSFMRPSTSICVLPVPTRDASVAVDEPTGNCLCEIPPPPVLPDNLDAQTECNLEADAYTFFKHPEFDSVDRFSQRFEEAKLAANSAFKELCEEVLRSNSSKDQLTDLKTRIATLTSENVSLLKRTLVLTEAVSSLKSITANSRHVPVMQRMVWFNILKLPRLQMPLDKYPEDVPPEYFFDLLNCSLFSTLEIIQENIRCLLQLLHPDKNPTDSPTANQFVPIVPYISTIILDPALLPVYNCCDFFDVFRRQRGYRSCKKCDPFLQSLEDLLDLHYSFIILYIVIFTVRLFLFAGRKPTKRRAV